MKIITENNVALQ